MKKRISLLVSVFISIALICGVVVSGSATESNNTDDSLTIELYVNNKLRDENLKASFVEDSLYVSVADFSKALYKDAEIEQSETKVEVTTENLTLSAVEGNIYIAANGRYLYVENGVQVIDDTVMVPCRILSQAFDATLTWNGLKNILNIKRGSGGILSGDEFYNSDDLYYLSRCIQGEAGGQALIGQIAVGTVIMNRRDNGHWGSTIKSVIYSPGQFETASYLTSLYPSELSTIAAKITLEGTRVIDTDIYYFAAAGTSCWAASRMSLVCTLGGNSFYR